MKKVVPSVVALLLIVTGCSNNKERYLDLVTGDAIEVKQDDKTGFMVNKETGEPLYIYVDTKKGDTIYAKTGKVINGHVVMGSDNKYVFDEDEKLKVEGDVKYKDEDYKMEIEKDGDTKIKNGDTKIKTDGESGKRKVKKD